jgi:tetratricopeptide (TPR) repeat protein
MIRAVTTKICFLLAPAMLAAACQILPPRDFFAQRITRRHPTNPHALFVEGKDYLKRDEPRKAAVRFGQALRLQPDFLEARLGLAHAWRDEKYYASASRLYEEVLREQPNNAQALEGLGVCATNLKKAEAARAALQRALELDPDSVSALNALAEFYYSRLEYARALECWDKSLRLDPEQKDLRLLVDDLRGYVAKYSSPKKAK